MTAKHFIAIDLEPGQGRVCLATADAGSVSSSLLHSFPIVPLDLPGGPVWDIYAIFSEVVKGLAIAGHRNVEPVSVGITGWGGDLVAMTRDGSFCGLPGVSAQDPVPEKYIQGLHKRLPEDTIYARSGVHSGSADTLRRLYAMRRRKSPALKAARYFLYLPAAIAWMLSGERFTEASIHSASGLMNRDKGKTDKELLSACKVKASRFPALVAPGRRVGRLSDEVARKTGLGKAYIVAVAQYAPVSAVQATPASSAEFAAVYCGSSAFVAMETEVFCQGPDHCRAADGRLLAFREVPGLEAVNRLRERWDAEDKSYSREELDNLGLPEEDAAEARRLYEGIAGGISGAVQEIAAATGRPVHAIHITGEGSADRRLCQTVADLSGITVVSGPVDPVITGNVIQQARSAGVFKSLAEARETVRRCSSTIIFSAIGK